MAKYKTTKSDKNRIRNLIITSIEMSRRSGVPILLASNPGYGKTSNVKWYARKNGYHLEVVIGSHYSPDEILGFMSKTNKSYLEVLEPEWYHRIMVYNEPHFEKKSSGWDYEFVEEEQVQLWQQNLADAKEKLEIAKSEYNKLSKEDDALKIKFAEIEVKKQEQRIVKYTAYLEDVEWVERRPSILFLDELSTTTGVTQGALLQLCFEFKIRGDKRLPTDCLVIGAANYKRNLAGYNNIIAPELNRFCIVNLMYGDKHSNPSRSDFKELGKSMVNEFLQGLKEVDTELPQFRNDFTFDETTCDLFLEDVRKDFISLFESYSTDIDSSKFVLDLRNIVYDDLYDRDDGLPELYNFLTPRTMSYYARIIKALCEMGVDRTGNFYKVFVDGLIGFGTNTFIKDDKDGFAAQLDEYQNKVYEFTTSLLDEYQENHKKINGKSKAISKASFTINDENNITGKVKKLVNLSMKNELGDMHDPTSIGRIIIDEVFGNVFSTYPIDKSPVVVIEMFQNMVSDTSKLLSFRSDYESVIELELFCERLQGNDDFLKGYKIYADGLNNWLDFYNFYYNSFGSFTMEDD